jgi:acyl-CoA reductase-like NAD-dependent aldehyde dehydrogenase
MPELAEIVPHYLEGRWAETPVHNPARGFVLARTSLANRAAVDGAVEAGRAAFQFCTDRTMTIWRWY